MREALAISDDRTTRGIALIGLGLGGQAAEFARVDQDSRKDTGGYWNTGVLAADRSRTLAIARKASWKQRFKLWLQSSNTT